MSGTSAPLMVTFGAATDVGRTRSHNEDCFRADRDAGFFLVVDGVGGQTSGQVASEAAADAIAAFIRDTAQDGNKTWPCGIDPALSRNGNRMRAAILSGNQAVSRLIQQDAALKGMAATMSAALVNGSRVVIANVGDCRAYLLRDERLFQITRDHSWVAEQVRSGLLDAESARGHPLRNVVTRAIAGEHHLDIDLMEFDHSPDDMLLLCSDGLHGPVPDAEIQAVMLDPALDPEQMSEQLIGLANDKGGPDNVTVVIVRIPPTAE